MPPLPGQDMRQVRQAFPDYQPHADLLPEVREIEGGMKSRAPKLVGMVDAIEFTLPVAPVAKGRPRFTRYGHVFTPAKTRQSARTIASMATPYAPAQPLIGPIRLTLRFVLSPPKRPKYQHPAVRPDLDNFCKQAMDSLSAFWVDDAQVVECNATKIYDWVGQPRIEVRIERIVA